MSKKIGIGYSFKEKSLEKENEKLKANEKKLKETQTALVKENEILKADKEKLEARIVELEAEKRKAEVKEPTKADLQAKLKELGIE